MLKDKLKAAVADLQKVYSAVVVRPGSAAGQIDLTVEPSSRTGKAGGFAATEILAAYGLQARGHVCSQQISKLFLRDIREIENQHPEASHGA